MYDFDVTTRRRRFKTAEGCAVCMKKRAESALAPVGLRRGLGRGPYVDFFLFSGMLLYGIRARKVSMKREQFRKCFDSARAAFGDHFFFFFFFLLACGKGHWFRFEGNSNWLY